MLQQQYNPLILDVGSYSTKIGIAECYDTFKEYRSKSVTDILDDYIEHYKLHLKDHPFINSESIIKSVQNEHICQLMFEKYHIQKYYSTLKAKLDLYQHAQFTGLIVDIGYETTQVVPILDEQCTSFTMRSSNIGGSTIDSYLKNHLDKSMEIEQFKTKNCHLQKDFKELTVQNCPEILFNTKLINSAQPGLEKLISLCLAFSDEVNRDRCLKNIILTGGSSNIMGMKERIQEIIQNEFKYKQVIVKKDSNKQAIFGAIYGGSLLHLSDQSWIQKWEYDEMGVSVLQRKCIHQSE